MSDQSQANQQPTITDPATGQPRALTIEQVPLPVSLVTALSNILHHARIEVPSGPGTYGPLTHAETDQLIGALNRAVIEAQGRVDMAAAARAAAEKAAADGENKADDPASPELQQAEAVAAAKPKPNGKAAAA